MMIENIIVISISLENVKIISKNFIKESDRIEYRTIFDNAYFICTLR